MIQTPTWDGGFADRGLRVPQHEGDEAIGGLKNWVDVGELISVALRCRGVVEGGCFITKLAIAGALIRWLVRMSQQRYCRGVGERNPKGKERVGTNLARRRSSPSTFIASHLVNSVQVGCLSPLSKFCDCKLAPTSSIVMRSVQGYRGCDLAMAGLALDWPAVVARVQGMVAPQADMHEHGAFAADISSPIFLMGFRASSWPFSTMNVH